MLDLVSDLVAETGASLMMVTHAPEDARRIADDLIFVADAKAHPTVPAAEALKTPSPALQEYLG
jgi:thiamine transport system ATP-binding protein